MIDDGGEMTILRSEHALINHVILLKKATGYLYSFKKDLVHNMIR